MSEEKLKVEEVRQIVKDRTWSPSVDMVAKVVAMQKKIQQLKAQKCLTDLYLFNTEVLKVQDGDGKIPLAPFHKELCNFVIDQKHKKKLILLPRGHLKSTLVTVGYSLQQIAKNPNVRILIANATYSMACAFLGQIKKHLQYNESFRNLYGDLSTGADKWSNDMITVKKEGDQFGKKEATVTAYGAGGNLVSQHYDIIILDDLVNRASINTKDQIESTKQVYSDMLDLSDAEKTQYIIIGTRWHFDDLYGWILRKEGVDERDIKEKGSMELSGPEFNVMVKQAVERGDLENGEILYPEKFTRKYLKSLKSEKGNLDFSCQYLNLPIDDENATFRREWFKYYEDHDIRGSNLNVFTTVDPAISEEKQADYSAIVTCGIDQFNNLFILDIVRERLNPLALIDRIFKIQEIYNPIQIGIETVAFQKALKPFIQGEMRNRGVFLHLVELKPDYRESKDMRIRGLQPRYESGTIYHPGSKEVKGKNVDYLEDELTRFPKGQYDDIVDALAYQLGIIYPPTKKGGIRGMIDKYLY